MLFGSAIRSSLRQSVRRAVVTPTTGASRHASSGAGVPPNLLSGWYSIFGSSTAGYMMWIVSGVLAAEFLTGAVTDAAWNSVNHGRTYDSVDWTKFIVEDDDDDDDDDDEDEDEDEEGGGDDDDEEDE